MRLIDADELKISLKGLLHDTWQYAGSCAVIDEAPTIDAVQVVRCKACVNRNFEISDNGKMYYGCKRINGLHPSDFFCKYGESEFEKCLM